MQHTNTSDTASNTAPTASPVVTLTADLSQVASVIRAHWKNVYFGAVPYLDALSTLHSIGDYYGQDAADNIVNYFLANARTWRGPVAKQVKAHLNKLIAH